MMLVYLIRNSVNGKGYVGWTSKTLARRFIVHCSMAKCGSRTYFHSSIRKHGKQAWSLIELAKVEDVSTAKEIETRYIQLFKTHDREHGYNLTLGGEGRTGPLGVIKSKECTKCHGIFVPRGGAQKFCDKCRMKTCPTCGKEFINPDSAHHVKFCSKICQLASPKKTTEQSIRSRAYSKVLRAVQSHRIPNPCSLPCFDCGRKAREYDHPRGYRGAQALDVEAVCRSCHGKRTWARGEHGEKSMVAVRRNARRMCSLNRRRFRERMQRCV